MEEFGKYKKGEGGGEEEGLGKIQIRKRRRVDDEDLLVVRGMRKGNEEEEERRENEKENGDQEERERDCEVEREKEREREFQKRKEKGKGKVTIEYPNQHLQSAHIKRDLNGRVGPRPSSPFGLSQRRLELKLKNRRKKQIEVEKETLRNVA